MNLRQLQYFVAVAKTRNFTRASEQLHIAQPPLSRQIQLLEEELGVTLLRRNSRPLRLTDAGRLFYEQAIQILGRIEQMKLATQQLGQNQRHVLSIGFVASALYGKLPLLIRRLRQQDPELDIQLQELTSMQQIEALKTGRIDIGFGRIRSHDPAVERIVLFEEQLMLALPPSSELGTDSAPVSLHCLAGKTLLVYPKEPRPSFADHILSILDDQQIQVGRIDEVRELQSALGLVAADVGMCIVPASARLRSDIGYRLLKEAQANSPIILSHRKHDQAWYVDLIRKLGQEIYAQ